MKRSRFSEEQIIAILKEQEAGAKTADVCRKYGISEATFYKYKAKYGGMDVSDDRRVLNGIFWTLGSGSPWQVPELCRQHGMSDASFYKWRAKYGGMDASMISEKKALEDENRRLKRMFADLAMQNELLKEALGKK